MEMLEQGIDIAEAQERTKLRLEAPLRLAEAQQGFVQGSTRNPHGQGISGALGSSSALAGQQQQQFLGQLGGYAQQYSYDQRTKALQGNDKGIASPTTSGHTYPKNYGGVNYTGQVNYDAIDYDGDHR